MARVRRLLVAFVLGGLSGAVAVVAVLAARPDLTFDFDRPLPSFISGFHGLERDGDLTFAWTADRVSARFDGIDRGIAWACTVRLRAPRPESAPAPVVEVLVDGARAASITAGGEFVDLGVSTPPSDTSGLDLALTVTPTFTPGTADRRDLGVQVDRLSCRAREGWVAPPWPALSGGAAAAGVIAGVVAFLGSSVLLGLIVGVIAAASSGVLMTIDGAAYSGYPATLAWLAIWMSAAIAAVGTALTALRRRALSGAAMAALACAIAGLFVKLAGLLHPAKPVIDAMFHAHRFGEVLAGHLYFTQIMPNGVTFPYAVGLYVVAAPFAWLTADHVALVRIVATSAEAIGGLLLYPMIAKAWGDRRAAVLAVAMFQMVPLSYDVLGNANLTNSFGQSAALFALAAVVLLGLGPRQWRQRAALVALMTLALCSHVSTVTLLPGVLAVTVIALYWLGGADLRQTARSIVLAGAIAMGLSVAVYWGHFGDVYRTALERVWAQPSAAAAAPSAESEGAYRPGAGEWGRVQGPTGLTARAANAAEQAARTVGGPMRLLSAGGVWSVWRRGLRDRLSCVLLGWAALWIGASAWTITTRVDYAYLRYAAEFLGRINLATYPLIVVLAARGVSWAWQDDLSPAIQSTMRIASSVLVLAAARLGTLAWIGWFSR